VLLDSVRIVKKAADDEDADTEEPELVGFRDCTRIGVMVYTFTRINVVLVMKARDYLVQGSRGMPAQTRRAPQHQNDNWRGGLS
jgi:hypothetical protein